MLLRQRKFSFDGLNRPVLKPPFDHQEMAPSIWHNNNNNSGLHRVHLLPHFNPRLPPQPPLSVMIRTAPPPPNGDQTLDHHRRTVLMRKRKFSKIGLKFNFRFSSNVSMVSYDQPTVQVKVHFTNLFQRKKMTVRYFFSKQSTLKLTEEQPGQLLVCPPAIPKL